MVAVTGGGGSLVLQEPDPGWPDALAAAHGVCRWPYALTPGDIEQAAQDIGRRCIVLDGADVETKDDFLEVCAQAFALPEWFAMSWEALEECLSDLDPSDGLVVVWSDPAAFAQSEPEEYASAVDVLSDVAARFRREHKAFAVLLLGDDLDRVEHLGAPGPVGGSEGGPGHDDRS
jgi:RNAse (barnase) inhibitor barstar